MKPTLATNSDILHLYPNRNYVSLSTKLSSSSYAKPVAYTFNSPKNETQKNIIFSSKYAQDNTKYSKKPEKTESTLERKNSRGNADTTPKANNFSSTYSSFTGSPRYNPSIKLLEGKRSSVDKPKNNPQDIYSPSSKYTSTSKLSESVNLKDALKHESVLTRNKNLEINTDYASARLPGSNIKSPVNKNREPSGTNEKIPQNEGFKKNAVSQYSFEFSSKFSKLQNGTNSTNNTEPNDERYSQAMKNSSLNRYSNYSQEKIGPTKKFQTEVQYGGNTSSAKTTVTSGTSGVKVNNFFNNGTSYDNNQKTSLNKSSKVDYDAYNTEADLARSADLSKKAFSKTQLDLRATLRGISLDTEKQKEQEAKQSMQKEAPKQESKNLQSFVTKVNRGDMFSNATAPKSTEKDDSPTKKPYLMLDDKYNKTPKANPTMTATPSSNSSSSLLYKGAPKTTTNQDSKSFQFGANKLSAAPTQSSNSQEAAKKTKLSKPSTPTSRGQSKENTEALTPTSPMEKKSSIVYYVTGLEKYHRNYYENDYFCQIYREHFLQTYQAMMFCRYLKPVDPKVLAQKRVFLSKRESHKDKRTLVFDLDETLIHCNESTDMPCDVKLPIRFPHGEIIEAGINIRPYVMECLKELSQYFEIIVFTASHGCYANVVLDYLDPKEQYIHHRLFRESCVTTDEGIYIKDLRVLANRNLQDVVIVDNAAYSFGYQIENGIPIIPFYDNKTDTELKTLTAYMKVLFASKDQRDVNKNTFRLHQYSQCETPDKVLEKIVFQK
jgi:CTD small phosphatase-like protein 2